MAKEEKEEVVCNECGNDFDKDSKVNACEDCNEVFCDDCAKEHAFERHAESEDPDCPECGNSVNEMYICSQCNHKACEDCIRTHIEDEHMDDFYRIYDSKEEYIADKV